MDAILNQAKANIELDKHHIQLQRRDELLQENQFRSKPPNEGVQQQGFGQELGAYANYQKKLKEQQKLEYQQFLKEQESKKGRHGVASMPPAPQFEQAKGPPHVSNNSNNNNPNVDPYEEILRKKRDEEAFYRQERPLSTQGPKRALDVRIDDPTPSGPRYAHSRPTSSQHPRDLTKHSLGLTELEELFLRRELDRRGRREGGFDGKRDAPREGDRLYNLDDRVGAERAYYDERRHNDGHHKKNLDEYKRYEEENEGQWRAPRTPQGQGPDGEWAPRHQEKGGYSRDRDNHYPPQGQVPKLNKQIDPPQSEPKLPANNFNPDQAKNKQQQYAEELKAQMKMKEEQKKKEKELDRNFGAPPTTALPGPRDPPKGGRADPPGKPPSTKQPSSIRGEGPMTRPGSRRDDRGGRLREGRAVGFEDEPETMGEREDLSRGDRRPRFPDAYDEKDPRGGYFPPPYGGMPPPFGYYPPPNAGGYYPGAPYPYMPYGPMMMPHGGGPPPPPEDYAHLIELLRKEQQRPSYFDPREKQNGAHLGNMSPPELPPAILKGGEQQPRGGAPKQGGHNNAAKMGQDDVPNDYFTNRPSSNQKPRNEPGVKKTYAEELQEQIRLKKEKDSQDKMRREQEEVRAANAIYDPFGKGGAGAPLKVGGKIVANLRQLRGQEGGPDQPGGSPSRPGSAGGPPPFDPSIPSPSPASYNSPTKMTPDMPPAGNTPVSNKITKVAQPGDEQKKIANLDYKEELRLQMEEKQRKKKEEEMKRKQEEEIEMQRIEKERIELQKAFEREQQAQREKEEKTRKENEEKQQQIEARRKEEDSRRKAAEAQRQEQIRKEEEEKRAVRAAPTNMNNEPPHTTTPAVRSSSPPIPTMRKDKPVSSVPPEHPPSSRPPSNRRPSRQGRQALPRGDQASSPPPNHPPEPFRSTSPPIPTLQKRQPPSSQPEPVPEPYVPSSRPPSGPSHIQRPPTHSSQRRVQGQDDRTINQAPRIIAGVSDPRAAHEIIEQFSAMRKKLQNQQEHIVQEISHTEEQKARLQEAARARAMLKKQADEMFDKMKQEPFARNPSVQDRSEPSPRVNAPIGDAPHRMARPLSPGAQSLISMTSMNVDALNKKNSERLHQLLSKQRENPHLRGRPENDDVLARFLDHPEPSFALMGGDDKSLQGETFYRPGSRGSLLP